MASAKGGSHVEGHIDEERTEETEEEALDSLVSGPSPIDQRVRRGKMWDA
jgi:hypothetical protein